MESCDSLRFPNVLEHHSHPLESRGPVQGFLLLSLPWFVCMACWVSGVGPPHPLSSRLITRQGRKPLEFHESE